MESLIVFSLVLILNILTNPGAQIGNSDLTFHNMLEQMYFADFRS